MNPIEEIEVSSEDLQKIIAVIKETHGFDFSQYALASFGRRVGRILSLSEKINTIEKLLERLRDKEYFENFLRNVTVNVTELFRDPSFWKVMRDRVLPDLIETFSIYDKIKIWHAGCATGEEVFSMTILAKEMNILDKIKILATDINQEVLNLAKSGKFPIPKVEDMNTANYKSFQGKSEITNYYTVQGKYGVINPMLIKNVTFQIHNLAQDAPFSDFHLIMCRNVLIYFNLNLQNSVVDLLYKSLIKGGFLALGNKETLALYPKIKSFALINDQEKIYQKISN